MAQGLDDFARRMDRLASTVESNETKLKRRVAAAVLATVIPNTPIRTGRARYSWNVGINAPDYSYDYHSFEAMSRTGDWVAKMATSRAAVARATAKDVIYISNGLPYIALLNRGWSPQASPRYVQASVRAGIFEARRLTLLR